MINRKTTLYLILLFSIFAVSTAYFIQYILGHQPCNLCLIERIPYVVSTVLILLFIFIQKFERFFLIILSITFIIAFVISFYHFGIEQSFIVIVAIIKEIKILIVARDNPKILKVASLQLTVTSFS